MGSQQMAISEHDLAKTLASLEDSAKAAEDGDKAEETRAVDALKHLQKQTVTAELLRKTAAGKRVNKLCKHTVGAISAAAKAAVEAWKDCVKSSGGQEAGPASQDAAASRQPAKVDTATISDDPGPPSTSAPAGGSQQPPASSQHSDPGSSKIDVTKSGSLPLPLGRTGSVAALGGWKVAPPRSGDDTRDKVRPHAPRRPTCVAHACWLHVTIMPQW